MGKRLIDLVIVVSCAPLWLPILVLCALVLWIFNGRPVFFVQQRAGRHGRAFNILKFRTMDDTRDNHGELLDDAARITPVGGFIRRTSLDEIPQLLNILKGDMSLVGPRPLLMEYLPLYSNEHRHRHDVLPGITGLAQIHGRNLLSWDERFDLDVQYAKKRSIGLDLMILVRTVGQVLRRHGISSAGEATMSRYRGPGS